MTLLHSMLAPLQLVRLCAVLTPPLSSTLSHNTNTHALKTNTNTPTLSKHQASWHPSSSAHFGVLASDNRWRLYHTARLAEAEQTFWLRLPGTTQVCVLVCVVEVVRLHPCVAYVCVCFELWCSPAFCTHPELLQHTHPRFLFSLYVSHMQLPLPLPLFHMQPTMQGGVGLLHRRRGAPAPPRATAFAFGPQNLGWASFAVLFLASDGGVYVLCPVAPFGSRARAAMLRQLPGVRDRGTVHTWLLVSFILGVGLV